MKVPYPSLQERLLKSLHLSPYNYYKRFPPALLPTWCAAALLL